MLCFFRSCSTASGHASCPVRARLLTLEDVIKLILTGAVLLTVSACSIPRWPVEAAPTSAWGLRLNNGWPEIHRGIDMAVPTGTPVKAMADGTVEFAGTMGGYGQVVIIRHNGHTRSLYAHLSELHVQTGVTVEGRAVIALSGATGNASGPHLHFEIQRWGRAEDPVPLLGGLPRWDRSPSRD